MHTAYLLLGGNMGNREAYLQQAQVLLRERAGKIMEVSSLYETAAWGKTDQPAFLNQVVKLETRLPAEELMNRLLKVEELVGRVRNEKFGPRIIDLDILLFDDEIHSSPHITIPHPQLPNRRFALEPLNELASELIHPQLQVTIQELLQQCTDPLPVSKLVV